MSRVFKIRAKSVLKSNGQVCTPEMEVIVTLKSSDSSPFNNGAVEFKEALFNKYGVDFKKGCFSLANFEYEKLD